MDDRAVGERRDARVVLEGEPGETIALDLLEVAVAKLSRAAGSSTASRRRTLARTGPPSATWPFGPRSSPRSRTTNGWSTTGRPSARFGSCARWPLL